MDLKYLRALLALHRRGTVAAAAEEVHLSPAAVSVQLKALEEHLGQELFVRTGRSIRLTAAGYQLLPKAEKLLRACEDLRRASQQGSVEGVVSLGVVNTALVGVFPIVIQRVMAEHPQLRVNVSAGTSPDLVHKVIAGVLDAAIVSCPPTALDEDFRVHRLYEEPFALVRQARSPCMSLAECLRSQPYIAIDRKTWTGRAIEEILSSRGVHVEPVMELNSHEAVIAAVRFGLGASVLPVIRQAQYQTDPQLRFSKIEGAARVIGLVERKDHVLSSLTAQILSTIAAVVEQPEE